MGHVDRKLDVNGWNAELKSILGWRGGPWVLALNANIDFPVLGAKTDSATLQLATKIGYQIREDSSVGFETYDGIGTLRKIGDFRGNDHSVFAVADTSLARWGLSLGVGHGYSGNPDGWIFRLIIGVPIE